MTARTDEEILQASLDGALSPEETARLGKRLEQDPALRAKGEALRRLAGLVASLGPTDPPEALADRVMDNVSVSHIEPATAWRRIRAGIDQLLGRVPGHVGQEPGGVRIVRWNAGSAGGGDIVAKKTLWAVAGIAVLIVLGVVYFNGTRSVDQGAQGTIGGAERYRGTQPASVAVKEGDAQKFLQSDLFDRIIKDKNVRSLLADAEVCALLGSDEIVSLMTGPTKDALLDDSVETALAKPANLKALQDAKVFAALADPDAMEALRKVEVLAALRDDGVDSALQQAEIQAQLSKPGVQRALEDAEFVSAALHRQVSVQAKLKDNPEFDSALKVSQFRALIEDPEFASALKVSQFRAMIENPEFEAALKVSQFRALIEDPEFESALKGPSLAKLLGEPHFASLVKNINAAKLFANLNWNAALKLRDFARLFEDADAVAALRHPELLGASLGQLK